MTGEAKPSEAEATESEFFASVIPVDEGKEEEKNLALSSALAEPVVDSNEDKQISGNVKGVKKIVVEIAPDIDASGKEVEIGENTEQEDVTEGERAVATALGAPVGALESLPPVRILRRFGFGKEAIDEVAGLAPSLRRIATAGGEEALQEASTQVLQNLIAKGVYKPEEEVFGGVTEAAGLGGGAGAIVGAIAELALGRRLRGTEPPPEEQEEGITEEPTPPVTPATGAETARRARVAPSGRDPASDGDWRQPLRF